MSEPYSPNLFLFNQYVREVLNEAKIKIKTGPFENLDIDGTLFPSQPFSRTTKINISTNSISTSSPPWATTAHANSPAPTTKN